MTDQKSKTPNDHDAAIRLRVGLFSLLGLLLIGGVTVVVNDRPFWWRSCNLVHINVVDATGLRMKSPVRSLGLQIGYIKKVELFETHVQLGICLTAPVEVLPTTRAYIRPEGFLGDQFVELKPVKAMREDDAPSSTSSFWSFFGGVAYAQDPVPAADRPKEIPMGEGNENLNQVIRKVDELVTELGGLARNLNKAFDAEKLKKTMDQLNRTLENAANTLSPENGLTATAQRALSKFEDSIEQLRQILSRINQGDGSVGKLINDESYASEIKQALENLNRLLGRVNRMRFAVNLGVARMTAYQASRGWLSVGIYPTPDRYYLIGVSVDPRGRVANTTTTTEVAGASTTTKTTQVEESGILLTGMLGKVLFNRLDLAAGVKYGDGTGHVGLLLGPEFDEERFMIGNDVYSRVGKQSGIGLNHRLYASVFPSRSKYLRTLYMTAGLDSWRKVDGKANLFFGAGVAFDDEDIKLLFSLK